MKSHIRRVEKFVAPSTANQIEGEEKQLGEEEGEEVKMETEYQQVKN